MDPDIFNELQRLDEERNPIPPCTPEESKWVDEVLAPAFEKMRFESSVLALIAETKRLIEKETSSAVAVEFIHGNNPNEVFVKAQSGNAVVWVSMELFPEDFRRPLSEFSRQYLEPAAWQCAQKLNAIRTIHAER